MAPLSGSRWSASSLATTGSTITATVPGMATAITGDLLPRQSIAIRDRLRVGSRNGTRAGTMRENLAGRMAGDAKARETITPPTLIVRPVRSRDRPPRPPAQPRHQPREAGARRNTHHDTGRRRWTSRARRPSHLRVSALLHQERCAERTATARGEGQKIDSVDANKAATPHTPGHIVIAICPSASSGNHTGPGTGREGVHHVSRLSA